MKTINEEQLHELARLFMEQFTFMNFNKLSLDEFLMEYEIILSEEELSLGKHILSMFED